MKMSWTATLSPKLRISIPEAVCEGLGWKAGQVLAFIPKGKRVLIVSVPDRDALTGIAEGCKALDYRDRNDRQ
jgi:bifunctional DNA-binding transcriptional regulator/antitoxin component of YhaV-PrlF toxin-antitoxin module